MWAHTDSVGSRQCEGHGADTGWDLCLLVVGKGGALADFPGSPPLPPACRSLLRTAGPPQGSPSSDGVC